MSIVMSSKPVTEIAERLPQRIPLSVPDLSGREAEYLARCVEENWVSTVGPFVTEFEAAFAEATGASHAVACASGTSALHLGLIAAGVEPGELVLVSTLTFIASANAVRYAGAEPVLVDCDPSSWQMDPALVEEFLTQECTSSKDGVRRRACGRRVAAIMPVHILGYAADVAAIAAIAERFGVPVVEDAAEGLGARSSIGAAGTVGAVGAFSFNGNKTITSGAGGMVVSDSAELAARMKHLSEQAKLPGRGYEHSEVGFNYRMSNLHAAVGLAQLERLDWRLQRKREIADAYRAAFADLDAVSWPEPTPGSTPAWWLPTIRLDASVGEITPSDRSSLAERAVAALAERGIEARPLWQPMHLSSPHREALRLGGDEAEFVFRTAVSLPASVGLSAADQARVIEGVRTLVIEGV